ncbi:threonine ammonia-lyase [Aestuariivivens sediminis]|uniref:threonine ammonia-lyase n=1 Tax=Aestuariivivens sediminis TaxID=2913557 RepID=UPI001F562CC4|nr:pyridoxal-phosphate dependent enzyme [Aestuariivivens sediminis]
MKITIQDILSAQKRISPHVFETPLEYSIDLSKEINTNVYLKLENLQVSGSFKPRGAFNKILKQQEINPKTEFVAPTAGGHGVGLSYAAKKLNAKVHILMPKDADKDRLKDIRTNNASIQLFESVTEARLEAKRLEKEKGFSYVSAYNDVEMIEGGGTIGLELLEQLPNVDCLVCGVGGGGYLAGLGIVMKSINPNIKLYGVQQENAPFLANWFRSKVYPSNFKIKPSIAEGIGAEVEEDSITWNYINEFVEDFLIVSEADIIDNIKWTIKNHKHFVEPSGIVGLAGIRKYPEIFNKFKNVATVITGRNMSYEKFLRIIK